MQGACQEPPLAGPTTGFSNRLPHRHSPDPEVSDLEAPVRRPQFVEQGCWQALGHDGRWEDSSDGRSPRFRPAGITLAA